MKTSRFWQLGFLLLLLLVAIAAVPAFTDFESTQFGVAGNLVRVKSGVVITNAINRGTAFQSPGSGVNSLQLGNGAISSGYQSIAIGDNASASASYALSIGSGGVVTKSNSVQVGSAAVTGTNSIGIGYNAIVAGDRAIALGTESTASHTNAIVIGYGASSTTTNQIMLGRSTETVNVPGTLVIPTGAGATKVLTSDASGNASWAAASGGAVVSVNATNLNPINLTNSATVTWAISGSNVTATDSPAALTWVTLTQSGTNISGFDPALGNYFKLTITNTAFIPAPSTLPSTTTPQNIELWILEDAVGTWSVTWATNYAFMNRTAPQQTTNASSIDIYTLSAHAFTNNIFSVVQTPYF